MEKVKIYKELFTKIYQFYNKPKNFKITEKFVPDLTEDY